MPWKLILFVICMVLVLVFAGLNMGNVSDISFGFKVFTDVPVFLSLLFAFILGIIFSLPFIIVARRPRHSRAGRMEAVLQEPEPWAARPPKKNKAPRKQKARKDPSGDNLPEGEAASHDDKIPF